MKINVEKFIRSSNISILNKQLVLLFLPQALIWLGTAHFPMKPLFKMLILSPSLIFALIFKMFCLTYLIAAHSWYCVKYGI